MPGIRHGRGQIDQRAGRISARTTAAMPGPVYLSARAPDGDRIVGKFFEQTIPQDITIGSSYRNHRLGCHKIDRMDLISSIFSLISSSIRLRWSDLDSKSSSISIRDFPFNEFP